MLSLGISSVLPFFEVAKTDAADQAEVESICKQRSEEKMLIMETAGLKIFFMHVPGYILFYRIRRVVVAVNTSEGDSVKIN